MSPRAVIVGPPGAGKTAVGELLAERLGLPFRDTDTDVEALAGRTIPEIFTHEGEAVFRELETRALATALEEHSGVLALGGGAVTTERNRALLADHPVVFLTVGASEGVRRTGLSAPRPLLTGVNPRATFQSLLRARLPLYREVADWEVDTDESTPAEIAEHVLARLGSTDSGPAVG